MKLVRWTIAVGVAQAVLVTGADAQTVKAPKPPPVMTVAPPAPPPPPPAPDHGPAPKSAAAPAVPLLPKEAKQLRRTRDADSAICFNMGELKDWMVANKLKACDRLLGMAPLADDLPVWRGRVLNQRALALINLGDDRNALAALDESDAIHTVVPDDQYDISGGIGSRMMRAFALNRRGDRAGALALLEEMRRMRPWSPTTASNADALEATFTNDFKAMGDRLAGQQRINPDVTRFLVLLYMMNGDVAKAVTVMDRVSLVDPKMAGGWTLSNAQSESDQFAEKVTFEALKAHLASANGDAARGKALLEGARASIVAYVGKDPALNADPKLKPRKSDIKRYGERKDLGEKLTVMLGEWEGLVTLRDRSRTMAFAEVMTEINKITNKADLLPGVVELMRNYARGRTGDDAVRATYFSDSLIRRTIGDDYMIKPAKLGEFLPRIETLDQIPKFASSASKWLFTDGSGYSQAKEGTGDVRTVRYESLIGSRAMVEELCLLAIANYARQEGKDAFVILSNRTLGRQTTVVGYWGGGGTSDSGFESQMRVQLVDSANLPAEFAGQKDRVITAAEIETQLKPRYDEYMRRKEAIAAAKKAAKKG